MLTRVSIPVEGLPEDYEAVLTKMGCSGFSTETVLNHENKPAFGTRAEVTFSLPKGWTCDRATVDVHPGDQKTHWTIKDGKGVEVIHAMQIIDGPSGAVSEFGSQIATKSLQPEVAERPRQITKRPTRGMALIPLFGS